MAKKYRSGEERLVGIIGDEDTVTGFLLAGVGDNNPKKKLGPNYFVVGKNTPVSEIESVFRSMVARSDIGMVLVCQHIANDIRYAIASHKEALPCVLEIPSKQIPFDESKDPVLSKLNRFLGGQ
jgi:V-type H+-transporting ATPase subunit F